VESNPEVPERERPSNRQPGKQLPVGLTTRFRRFGWQYPEKGVDVFRLAIDAVDEQVAVGRAMVHESAQLCHCVLATTKSSPRTEFKPFVRREGRQWWC
jgi:hypothetical protein